MNTQNTLDSIPTDLLHEILSRLPAKSVGRCRCVSRILASRLGSEDFKQLFLKRSLTRPLLLFAFAFRGENNVPWWVFYSSPQPQPQNEKLSLVLTAEFPRLRVSDYSYASGLFYFPKMCISTTKGEEDMSHVICNPSTGEYVILPELETDIWRKNFLGFDPIEKQFKLFVTNTRENNEMVHFILTVGTGKMRWRTIQCPFLRDYPRISSNEICINGVLYYLAKDKGRRSCVIVCFDVRTETFKFKPIVIDIHDVSRQLINYKGKLCITILRQRFDDNGVDVYLDIELYILEDVEEQELSKYLYTLPTINFKHILSVVGMTSTGEIVLSTIYKPFCLYYFNLEKNSLQSVEVQGSENPGYLVRVIMDHVEDLHLCDAKYFKSNIHPNPREAPRTSKRQRHPAKV